MLPRGYILETHESRKKKLTERIRKGRAICVQGYIREYRKDDSVTAPIEPLSRLISLLEKSRESRLNAVHKRTQRRATQKLTRHRIIEMGPRKVANGWYGWNSDLHNENL